jgi:hypothetical protein
MTKKEFLKKIKAVEPEDDEQRNDIACSLIGHSKIVHYCFGEITCARCDDRIGDTLMGAYSAKENVIVGHNCDDCRANYKKLTWRDKIYAPTEEEIFKDAKEEAAEG